MAMFGRRAHPLRLRVEHLLNLWTQIHRPLEASNVWAYRRSAVDKPFQRSPLNGKALIWNDPATPIISSLSFSFLLLPPC